MLLFIVLSAAILLGWTVLSERFLPVANPPATKIVDGKSVPLPKTGADPAAETLPAVRSRAAVLRETPRIAIQTPRLQGTINLRGARIDDLVLSDHRQSIAKDSPPIRLLSPGGAPRAYFAAFGWTGQGLSLPGPDTVWTATGSRLAPDSPVTLSWDNAQGQRFVITVS